ncbi:MAG: phage terminase large subunit, partial [Oscillospiraceae bacterium]|nr:phage terminase large subunit [Oscillospiraceae bacterium]
NSYYLRYCLNRHMDFPETVRAIATVRRLYPQAMTVLIEDKANGSAIIQTLQKEMFCVPVTPMGGKTARVSAVSPAIESGHVYLPRGEEWVEAFVDQFTAFPVGKHDDMVDSATQAIGYLLHVSGETDTREQRQEDDAQALFDACLSEYF